MIVLAIEKIKCLRIIGTAEKLSETAELLVESECFQPDDPMSFHSDIKMFIPVQIQNTYGDISERFYSVLDSENISRSLTAVPKDGLNDDIARDIVTLTDTLQDFSDRKYKLSAEIEKCKHTIEQISHFTGLDFPMEKINECKYIKANFGKLPKESFDRMQHYSDNPFVMFFPTTHDDNYYWGLYLAPISDSDDVDRIFSSLYFESSGVLDLNGTPEEYCEEQKQRLPKLEEELDALNEDFTKYLEKNRDKIDLYHSYFTDIERKQLLLSKAVTYKKSFVMVGWVTEDKADELCKKLKQIDTVECTLTSGKSELKHSPPVKLKNNFFTRGYEYYTEMYGLPRYGEFDPTSFVAITYTLLFGIMFGDVGHGLVVMLFGILMKKKKNPLGGILIPCGISGAVFGLIYGSVFGFEHLLDPLYSKLFGWEEKPISVMEPATINTIIYLAIGIGMALVTVAMILNIVISLKKRDIENGVFGNNGVCGLMFYVSVVAAVVGSIIFGVSIATPAYIICLIAIPLAIIFLKEPLGRLCEGKKNWQPESWGGYCIQNFFELFEVLLSYVTNTMSFLRVGAFVLVHAGMMEVVFTLANMASGVGYIAILVIGNIFVMGLEALLVCIQVLRLEFYEMFGRFYSGDGREFKPVTSLSE